MTSSDTILERMRVAGHDGLYALGSGESRVTLYSQQVRALNLAWALADRSLVRQGTAVGIVGAGAAGLTAAAGLGRIGATVDIFESHEVVLPRFRGNTQRYLHPHAYDWPAPGYSALRAGLPIMNWEAAAASAVAAQLERAWHVQRATATAIELHLSTRVTKVDTSTRGLIWRGPKNDHKKFDVIIFAVGVGTESRTAGTPTYWENDSLSQVVFGGPKTVLISGAGDGGLVDLARASLHEFDHARLVLQFLQSWRANQLQDRLLGIEASASADGYDLDAAYAQLDLSRVREHILGNLRRDRTITLNVSGPKTLRRDTMILNRVIFECIRREGLEVWRGPLKSVEADNGRLTARLEDGRTGAFDSVVLRHGPRSDLEAEFPAIKSAFDGKVRSNLDPTRVPAWPDRFFDEFRDPPIQHRCPRQFSVVEIDAGFGLESQAWSLNESGSAVGWSYLPTFPQHGFFVWDGTGLPPEIGTVPGAVQMAATAINSLGDYVVSTEGGGGQAWLVSRGRLTLLEGPDPQAMPYSINSRGLVVGYCGNSPCVWTQGQCRLLPDEGFGGVALHISDGGAIVGEVRITRNGNLAAARWIGTEYETFEPPSGYYTARAFGVNSHGDAVGYLMRNNDSSHFFVWPKDGPARIIGQGEAYALNDAGCVVGRAGARGAYLYFEGQMHWFADLVDPSWVIEWPRSILNDFRIVGSGRWQGVSRAVLLIPRQR